jgi:hypothetical protein
VQTEWHSRPEFRTGIGHAVFFTIRLVTPSCLSSAELSLLPSAAGRARGFTQSTTILERPEQDFRARFETATHIWSETDGAGGFVFR